MSNQMNRRSSYLQHKATRRANRRAEFAAQQAALGGGSDIDGIQAGIDLAVEQGIVIRADLCQSYMAQGYFVPNSIRPERIRDESGEAPTSPDSEAPRAEKPCTDQDTTDRAECQALLDNPEVEGIAINGPWTKPTTSYGINGRWNNYSPVSWFAAKAEAERRGWAFDGYVYRPAMAGAR